MAKLLFASIIFIASRFSCLFASNSDTIYYFSLNSTTVSGVKKSGGYCSDLSSVTVQGSPLTIVQGPDPLQSDSALNVSSNNWINLGDFRDTCISNPSLCSNGMSVSFWVRLDASGSGDRHVIVTGKMDTSRGIQVFYTNSHTNVLLCDGTKRFPVEIDFPAHWTHVVAVYNPSGSTAADKFYVYVNGTTKETARYETACGYTDSDTNLLIGHDNVGSSLSGSRQFAISQLAFFYKPLNQTEIQNIYSNPSSGIQLDCQVPPTTVISTVTTDAAATGTGSTAATGTGSNADTTTSPSGSRDSQIGNDSDDESRTPTVLILLSVSLFLLLVIVIAIIIGCIIIFPSAKEKGYKCL